MSIDIAFGQCVLKSAVSLACCFTNKNNTFIN